MTVQVSFVIYVGITAVDKPYTVLHAAWLSSDPAFDPPTHFKPEDMVEAVMRDCKLNESNLEMLPPDGNYRISGRADVFFYPLDKDLAVDVRIRDSGYQPAESGTLHFIKQQKEGQVMVHVPLKVRYL